jgi:hypothetical protein
VHTCWPTYYKEREECKPEVSMTIGMFFSRANRKTFSSLRAIPSGLICMHTIAQAILMMCGKEIKKQQHIIRTYFFIPETIDQEQMTSQFDLIQGYI